jgi:hypothetical protein
VTLFRGLTYRFLSGEICLAPFFNIFVLGETVNCLLPCFPSVYGFVDAAACTGPRHLPGLFFFIKGGGIKDLGVIKKIL